MGLVTQAAVRTSGSAFSVVFSLASILMGTLEPCDEGIHEPDGNQDWDLPTPFSAVTQTIRPVDGTLKYDLCLSEEEITQRADEGSTKRTKKPSIIIDEFGFKIDREKEALPQPLIKSVENRRVWMACLEFSYTGRFGDSNEIGEECGSEDSLWSRLLPRLSASPRLTELIRGLEDPQNSGERLKWSGVPNPDSKLSPRDGIPHSIRAQIWPRLTRAYEQQQASSDGGGGGRKVPLSYAEVIRYSSSVSPKVARQIEKDLLRTMPNNVCFSSGLSIGIPRLRRILTAFAWLYTDIGYCQGLGVIAANLLLLLEEETAFWMMCAIVDEVLPSSYFSADSLLGVQADQRVLCQLISVFLPRINAILQQHDVDLPLITLGWFLTLFSGVLPMQIVLRVWDLLFYEGSTVLFRISLAILKIKEEALVSATNTASFFNEISNAPGSIKDVVELIKTAYSFEEEYLDPTYIDGLRRHHLSQLIVEMSSQGRENEHARPLPKQFLSKRELDESRYGGPLSLFCGVFGGRARTFRPQEEMENVLVERNVSEVIQEAPPMLIADEHTRIDYYRQFHDLNTADPKIKNIRQTELLVNLRQAILVIVRHFHYIDPSHEKVSSQPDYSLASHGRDLTAYVQMAAVQSRRAKALEDFARQEKDELGFLRHDIVTVVDMHDEHCWLGEMNGLRGWFPAKLVELLDERSKRYSYAGDDSVYPGVGSLVRRGLCSTLCAIFEYGLKKTRGLTDQSSSPWRFIEEVAVWEAERDSSSIHSRLVLCRTFRLDEVGKVLSPEELLYRSIQNINASHPSPSVSDDAKFRTLVCIGLNELVLHLWLEILCSCEEVVTKWYHPWSFLRSPGWVQIKCELRVLSQFAFHLNPLAEVSEAVCQKRDHSDSGTGAEVRRLFRAAKMPLRLLSRLGLGGLRPLREYQRLGQDFGAFRYDFESTGDMLVKYHLFSWEL
ncbi:small g protein signaling modulator 3 [Echinococcus multilocularis]|uniref:RUN and TBC1 domain-containing protein 3 n=1 Tax=Echinococcus multilocularis TaxID=6211 RepID=A0A068Y2B3_ECHMU|nr:small g protein signaling modulator 3 [Echinococcus multilocularis]